MDRVLLREGTISRKQDWAEIVEANAGEHPQKQRLSVASRSVCKSFLFFLHSTKSTVSIFTVAKI